MPVFLGSVFGCQVAGLFLALLVCTSHQADCPGVVQCPGNRPLLPNGCCQGLAGHECRPAEGQLCDTDLGFSCVNKAGNLVSNETGWCKGRYDLRPSDRKATSLTVEWTAFAPTHYEYEYILMIRKDSYHYDVSQWEERESGEEPRYQIQDLNPSTLYLIKVAIWKDVRTWTIGNISETIMVKTEDVEFCEVKEIGSQFKVGENFQVEGEDNCTCLPSGKLDCVPLCQETGIPELQDGCRVNYDENHCKYTIMCPVGGESCTLDNQTHPHGSEIEQGCKICTCNHGNMECVYPSYCPTAKPSTSCLRPKAVDMEGECCPQWSCEYDLCDYENKTYSDGEFFTSSQCGLCQCNVTEGVQCASADCPPVEMVLPDASCPDPHIRQTGCCDTLHCFDPDMDALSFVQNVFALYYTPVTLTLSFMVETISEVQGAPVYCQYEIFYANTSSLPIRWHNEIVQPVDRLKLADGSAAKAPREALIEDSAIVVNMRAFVTLSGMQHPDTSYYVTIKKIEAQKEDMGDGDKHDEKHDINNSFPAMVVVKTRALRNVTSCFHSGREFLHGDIVPSSCNQICQCLFGGIHCENACPDQQVVVLPSTTCPNTRLEKEEGECCPQWKCYRSEFGCHHGNAILEAGQSVNDGCRECTCINSTMKCRSLCPSHDSPPRHGCVFTNISGSCCPQWSCPREEQHPIGVKRSVLMVFLGTCPYDAPNFENDVISHFHEYISQLVDCSKDSVENYHICNTMSMRVDCYETSSQKKNRQRRSLSPSDNRNITELTVTLERNLSSPFDTAVVSEIDLSISKLQELLNTSFSLHLTNGSVLQSTKQNYLQPIRYICNPGFAYANGQCVISEIILDGSPMIQADLSIVKLSSKMALIQWTPLNKSFQDQLKHLVIKYKANGSLVWSSTENFLPWVTSCVLVQLTPGTMYVAKLVASPSSSRKNKWMLADITFETVSYTGPIPKDLKVHDMYPSDTSIILLWNRLPEELLDHIKSISVIYGTSSSKQMHKKIPVYGTQVAWLTDLLPNQKYTAVVKVLMFSGEKIKSQKLELVTQKILTAPQVTNKIWLIVLVIICAVTAAVLTFCIVLYCRKNSRKSGNGGFENKSFGVQLENSPGPIAVVNTSSNS